jgi:hypothetical protein
MLWFYRGSSRAISLRAATVPVVNLRLCETVAVAVPIYHVAISRRINEKINAKQPGVTAREVREVCYEPKRHNARWRHDPEHGGWRLFVTGRTAGGRLLRIILYPVDVDQGKWRLKTANAG